MSSLITRLPTIPDDSTVDELIALMRKTKLDRLRTELVTLRSFDPDTFNSFVQFFTDAAK